MINREAIEKIKSTHAEIIVCGKVKKPYFQIRYFDLSDHETHVGYGSYKLEFVFQWLEECFEIIKENTIDNDIQLISPISIEQYAEENTKLKAETEQLRRLSDQQSELNIEQFKQIDNQYQEIEQLKSELEQYVKLPKTDKESEKERMIIWLNDFCNKFTKCDKCIFNGRCREFDEMDFDEIKSQCEEAEQHLKGQVPE